MQTFLPYQSFTKSLKCLDDKRLGKQRVEAMQILNALQLGSTSRWKNHPAVKMWKGYEDCLEQYKNEAIEQWTNRGFNNSMWLTYEYQTDGKLTVPFWLTEEFCAAHRSNLLRKDNGKGLTHTRMPYSYHSLGWKEPDDLPYIWPK